MGKLIGVSFLLFTAIFNGYLCKQKFSKTLEVGLTVVGTALEIFNTALTVMDFIDQKEDDPEVTQSDLQNLRTQILQDIAKLLENSKSDIILVLTLQSEVATIKDITNAIDSQMTDLKHYLQTENTTYQNIYEDQFKKHYLEHDMTIKIRRLSTLLEDYVPELSKPLKTLIIDSTNCNMTSITEFERYFVVVLREAMVLRLVDAKFNGENMDIVENDWNERLNDTQDTFDEMEEECENRLPKSISQEIQEEISLELLHRNSAERYNWKWNDVFEYQPTNSYSFHYIKSLPDPDFLAWNGPSKNPNRIMVLGNKNTPVTNWHNAEIQTQLENKTSIFQAANNKENPAKSLGIAIGDYINELNFIYKGIIVFYEHKNYPVTVIIDDQQSLAAYVYVPVNDNAGYHVYVYPEIWNNFTSYFKFYSEHELCCKASYNLPLCTAIFLTSVLVVIGNRWLD